MHRLRLQTRPLQTPLTVQGGQSPFGPFRLTRTAQGICQLGWQTGDPGEADRELQRHWPGCPVQHLPHPVDWALLVSQPQTLHLAGTAFQQRVWAALLAIPAGQTRSYGELASTIGLPRAARAVGTAAGRNPVALLVPCHRLLAAGQRLGGYRWGSSLKRDLLAAEGITVTR